MQFCKAVKYFPYKLQFAQQCKPAEPTNKMRMSAIHVAAGCSYNLNKRYKEKMLSKRNERKKLQMRISAGRNKQTYLVAETVSICKNVPGRLS